MRIRIVQSGGFAGLRKERVVETAELPSDERAWLEGVIERSAFFLLPPRQLSGMPDVIQYRVCIEDAHREHEVTFDDERVSEPLRELVALLLAPDGGA